MCFTIWSLKNTCINMIFLFFKCTFLCYSDLIPNNGSCEYFCVTKTCINCVMKSITKYLCLKKKNVFHSVEKKINAHSILNTLIIHFVISIIQLIPFLFCEKILTLILIFISLCLYETKYFVLMNFQL